jgi:hypothetical protein
MYRVLIIMIVLLVFVLPAAAFAQVSTEGVINGQVINGTEGGGSVAGIEVTLVTYIDDIMSETKTTVTDNEGEFQFINVATANEYLVTVKYMGVDYYYPVAFETGETTTFVEVGVCDTTTSDETIGIGLFHIIVSIEEEIIQVIQVLWLFNDSDKTYVGTDGVLVFTLPEGASCFQAPQELMPDFQELDDNRVTYLVPFPPGERQLIYSYNLAKPDSGESAISLSTDYYTESLELMIGGEDVEVVVNQLAPAEPVVTETGERFIHFWGENIPRDTVITLRITSMSGGSGLFFIILWIVITLVIIGMAIYLVRRKRRVVKSE